MVYRAGDAISAWAKALLDSLGAGVLLAALAGAVCAAVWGLLGWYLGGRETPKAQLEGLPPGHETSRKSDLY
ncbi:hypothetical protein D3C76_829080 [compost metagenome]